MTKEAAENKTINVTVTEIVSGGQTGVDRAGLDAAIFLQIPHGGWCPKGRLAEDGVIPDQYELKETDSKKYPVRTEKNVIDSDATLILYFQALTGGTKLTRRMASKHGRACLSIDLAQENDIDHVRQWLSRHNVSTLNIAGPRESTSPGVSDLAREFLLSVLLED